jgi:N-acyl-L-homoserine lactone synthetase
MTEIALGSIVLVVCAALAYVVHDTAHVIAQRDATITRHERQYAELLECALMVSWGLDRAAFRVKEIQDSHACGDNVAVACKLFATRHELQQIQRTDSTGFQPTEVKPLVIPRHVMSVLDFRLPEA